MIWYIIFLEPELQTLTKEYDNSHRRERMLFCRVPGSYLNTGLIETTNAGTAGKCILLCTGHSQCLSTNYHLSNGDCELIGAIDQGNDVDFNVNPQYDHYTSRECADY